MKKVKKKTKLKIVPLFIFFLFLIIVFFVVSFLLDLKIKNIFIYNNTLLTDQEILELANLQDYPSFLTTSISKVEKLIEENKYIKNVEVKRGFLSIFNIYVTEHNLLFINESTGNIVADAETEISVDDKTIKLPTLINYVPDTIYSLFIDEMVKIDNGIKDQISQIEYSPNDYDKQRFLIYMSDGNKVYITITRFNLINKYNDIYPTLGGKKGILYLDSGNHFEIKG